MRVLGFLVVAFFLILGVIGLFAPHRLFAIAQFTTTPTGLYVVAAVRLGIGAVLLGVAPRSKFPKILRVLGVLALIGGIATLFLGSDRAHAIVNWVETFGTVLVRSFGVFALLIGSFIAYAISGKELTIER
jgi:hypothetical protein